MANNEDKQDVEMGNKETPAVHPAPPILLEQARLGNLDLFRAELQSSNHPLDFKAGPDVYSNRTPLHLVAMQGHEDIVEFILKHPDISSQVVNAKDCFGYTPLHLAVRYLNESVVRLLISSLLVLPDRFLAATSELDDLDEKRGGHTPLHLAAVMGNTTIARLLLRQPCQVEFAYDPVNIRATTWQGDTPVDIARRKKFEELVEFLESSDLTWLQQERERLAVSANAILVGAALVAAAAFGSWLQPPGGIPAPDNSGAPSSSSLDRNWNSIFYLYVAVAFAFSVVALVIGTLATFPYTPDSLHVEVQQLRRAVKLARRCLVFAILSLIYCFMYAGSLVIDKVASINGKFSNARYKIISWLPIITYAYIGYYEISYSLRMGGSYGNKNRAFIVCSMLVGAAITAVVLTIVDQTAK